jgi:hypothetical protein
MMSVSDERIMGELVGAAETSGHAVPSPRGEPVREKLEAQARRRGLRPIRSAEDLICDGVFESDEELDAFLSHLYASRRDGLA